MCLPKQGDLDLLMKEDFQVFRHENRKLLMKSTSQQKIDRNCIKILENEHCSVLQKWADFTLFKDSSEVSYLQRFY